MARLNKISMSDGSCCCCVTGVVEGEQKGFLVVSRAPAWNRISRDHVHVETIDTKPTRDFRAPLKALSKFYEKINTSPPSPLMFSMKTFQY